MIRHILEWLILHSSTSFFSTWRMFFQPTLQQLSDCQKIINLRWLLAVCHHHNIQVDSILCVPCVDSHHHRPFLYIRCHGTQVWLAFRSHNRSLFLDHLVHQNWVEWTLEAKNTLRHYSFLVSHHCL